MIKCWRDFLKATGRTPMSVESQIMQDAELERRAATEEILKQIQIELEKTAKMTDIKDTLKERGEKYGEFINHAAISQRLKQVMGDTAGWQRLTPAMKEALEMLAHKVARILNGDPTYIDSWVDISGYVTLVVQLLEGFVSKPSSGNFEDYIEQLAGALYTNYCKDVGGKAFNGDPLPTWFQFRSDPAKRVQSDAWVGIAKLAHKLIITK